MLAGSSPLPQNDDHCLEFHYSEFGKNLLLWLKNTRGEAVSAKCSSSDSLGGKGNSVLTEFYSAKPYECEKSSIQT